MTENIKTHCDITANLIQEAYDNFIKWLTTEELNEYEIIGDYTGYESPDITHYENKHGE